MLLANHEANHKDEAIYKEAFYLEHSALSNYITIEEETQPEDLSIV